MNNTISKSKLKARMLEIFRELETSGSELIVTDRDRPVLKIIPIKSKTAVDDLFSGIQGKVVYHEEINTPTLLEWEDV